LEVALNTINQSKPTMYLCYKGYNVVLITMLVVTLYNNYLFKL
jgi:hypothetical protein